MRSSIQKYLHVLHDHDISAHGVGARHSNIPTPEGGGGYLNNYSKLELSLSASELEAAFDCLKLPPHWRDILEHIGAVKFLEMWRRLESIRTERQLRMKIPGYTQKHHEMSESEFEAWLDGQRLMKEFFEIYVTVTAEEYRYIWHRLYRAAYYPNRRFLRVYVPEYSIFQRHLRTILAYSLLNTGMNVSRIPHQLMNWTINSLSVNRLNTMLRRMKSTLLTTDDSGLIEP